MSAELSSEARAPVSAAGAITDPFTSALSPRLSHAERITSCESARGDWGEVCPDCGQRLPPAPGPLRSWKAAKQPPEGIGWNGAVVQPNRERASLAQRERWTVPSVGRGRAPSLYMGDVVNVLRATGGNVNAAAEILSVARQSMLAFLNRNRADVPPDVAALVDARRRPRPTEVTA